MKGSPVKIVDTSDAHIDIELLSVALAHVRSEGARLAALRSSVTRSDLRVHRATCRALHRDLYRMTMALTSHSIAIAVWDRKMIDVIATQMVVRVVTGTIAHHGRGMTPVELARARQLYFERLDIPITSRRFCGCFERAMRVALRVHDTGVENEGVHWPIVLPPRLADESATHFKNAACSP